MQRRPAVFFAPRLRGLPALCTRGRLPYLRAGGASLKRAPAPAVFRPGGGAFRGKRKKIGTKVHYPTSTDVIG